LPKGATENNPAHGYGSLEPRGRRSCGARGCTRLAGGGILGPTITGGTNGRRRARARSAAEGGPSLSAGGGVPPDGASIRSCHLRGGVGGPGGVLVGMGEAARLVRELEPGPGLAAAAREVVRRREAERQPQLSRPACRWS